MRSFLAFALLLSSAAAQALTIDQAASEVPLTRLLELYSPEVRRSIYLKDITTLMQQGRRDEANIRIAKMLARNPRDRDALELAGISLMQMKNFEAAEESFQRLVAMPPVKPEVISKYGVTKILNGDLNGGVTLLYQVVQFEPNDMLAHRYLAVAAEYLGNHGNAAYHLEKLPSVGPAGLQEHHVALARNYIELKRYQDVIDLLGPVFTDPKAVEQGMPASAALYLTLARNAAGQLAAAETLETHLRDLFVDNPVDLFALDIGLARVRKDAGAGRAAYERFTGKVNQTDAQVSAGYELALVYLAAGEHLAAIEELEKVLGLAQDQHTTAEILRLLVPEFVAQSMISDAIGVMEKSIGKYPDDLTLVYGLAELKIRAGLYQAAQQDIKRLLAMDPPYTPAYLLGGNLARKTGDVRLARQYLTAYTKAEPTRMDGWASLAGSHVDTGDTAGAIKVLIAGVAAAPTESRLHFELGSLYESTGNLEAANASYRAALERDPNYLPVLDNLGANLLDMNRDIDEAYGYARKAYEMAPQDPFIVDLWGWARYRKGELEEAKELLQAAAPAMQDSGRADYHLGLTLRDLGDKRGAVEHLQLALKKGIRDRQLSQVQEALRQLQ